MRLAIFDNLANNAYLQAKAFRRRGHEIDLVLDPRDRFIMSDPRWEDLELEVAPDDFGSAMLPANPAEPTWVRRAPPPRVTSRAGALLQAAAGAARAPSPALEALRRGGPLAAVTAGLQRWVVDTLREYDAVIAYGVGPIYARLAGVPFLAQTWGGDMTITPFRDAPAGQRGELPEPEQSAPHAPRRDASMARMQRWGLAGAHRVLLTDPRFFPFAERIGLGDRAIFLPFVMDTGKYSPGEEPELRRELLGPDGRTLVFVPSRLDFHWKGSDRMLRGVAAAMANDDGLVLACAGWGVDREPARALAAELGVSDRVRFLPNAFSKTRLLRYYRAADIVLDQFAIGSYGSSALEAMSVGRPLLMYLEPERFSQVFGTPPLVNVREPAEIATALVRLAGNPDERERVARAQRSWVVSHQGDDLADEAHALLVDAVRARAGQQVA